jgi:hypothetical protein
MVAGKKRCPTTPWAKPGVPLAASSTPSGALKTNFLMESPVV